VIEDRNAEAEVSRLRANNPPVIARIEHDKVVLDLRTVLPDEEGLLVQALS
jgi:L-seryl-tRNA(Ser) seleniumtransferase